MPVTHVDKESFQQFLPTIKETFHILNRFNTKFETQSSIWLCIEEEMREVSSIVEEEIENLKEYFELLEEYSKIELLERSLTIQQIQYESLNSTK